MTIRDEKEYPRVFICDSCTKSATVDNPHADVPSRWYFVAVGHATHHLGIDNAQVVYHFCSLECLDLWAGRGFQIDPEF